MTAPISRSNTNIDSAPLVEMPIAGKGMFRWLYTNNPFYLLSVCCLFHGVALWFNSETGTRDVWWLVGLIAGYTVMMSFSAWAIVRFGRVWDDARTIFSIILVLLLVLALSLDYAILSNIHHARLIACLGYGFAALILESLVLGLKIRLPVLFRLPLHGLFALQFFYPLVLIPDGVDKDPNFISWRIYMFSPIAAGLFLTFLPAARTSVAYISNNGTPWKWPLFPWAFVGLVACCVGVRSYSLSLTFDPVMNLSLPQAMQLQSAFGGYFLVPMLLAAGLVMLEIGITHRRELLQRIALAIVAGCLFISFPYLVSNQPHLEFLSQFVRNVGSPVFMTAVAVCLIVAYAAIRKVRFAETMLVAAMFVASFLTPDTVRIENISSPNPLTFGAIALLQWGLCIQRLESRRVFLGSVAGILAIFFEPSIRSALGLSGFVVAELIGGCILIVGAIFKDEFAEALRVIGVIVLWGATLAVFFDVIQSSSSADGSSLVIYGTILAAASIMMAVATKNYVYLGIGLLNMSMVAVLMFIQISRRWPGIQSFLAAGALFLLAFGISVAKAMRNSRTAANDPPG